MTGMKPKTFFGGMLATVLASTLAVPRATALPDDPPCPFAGIQTANFAYDPDAYTTWSMGWSPEKCSVVLQMIKNPNIFIGNYYLVEHYLIYGQQRLDPPFTIGEPFYGDLLVLPDDILGPFPGGSSDLAVPPDPALVGLTFEFQAIATFITTVHFPIEPEYVMLHGITGTFQ
jgi:hypothetical protein